MSELLAIEDLSVSFAADGARVRAVKGVSYSVEGGEIVGVVGESGSGKSVHALSIVRLIRPPAGRIDGGRVLFEGRDLMTLGDRAMREVRGAKIGMVFQDPVSSLNPVYTVGFQIIETLRRHLSITRAQAQARAAELLRIVGIPDSAQRLKAYPHEMSGGMRQRVMIAMAIACNPKLLIADEPTTALDATVQAQVIALVKRLRRELGLAVIWISHDLGSLAGLADTLNVMYAGRIVERGPAPAIFAAPRHPYTVGLLGSIPHGGKEDGELVSIPGRPPDLAHLGPGCPFAPRCALATPICHEDMPPVTMVASPDHSVRCWNWAQVSPERLLNHV